jgi:2-C-methyl-D-erythritol 4-phosphate cytidylyltransferase
VTGRLTALVPAAGGGRRFGGDTPKQYAPIDGRALLARTLDRLAATFSSLDIVVALAADDALYDAQVGARANVVTLRCGGATRAATVAQALASLAARCSADDWIIVHDAARPCVPVEALLRLVAELSTDAVGGLLAVPAGDTLKREDAREPGRVLATEDRTRIWQAQTPQMFRYGLLRDAYALPGALETTDEAQAIEALAATGACLRPRLVAGSAENIKVTYPSDLALAGAILAAQEGRA